MSCVACGKEVVGRNGNSKYCSKECRYEAYKQHLRESTVRTCKRCGKGIDSPEANTRAKLYCSDYCHTGKDGKYRVYILPKSNYAGMTYRIWERMNQHETKGRYVDDMEIVGVFDNPIEAHLLETQLHLEGYEGFYVERAYDKLKVV